MDINVTAICTPIYGVTSPPGIYEQYKSPQQEQLEKLKQLEDEIKQLKEEVRQLKTELDIRFGIAQETIGK